MEHHHDSLLRTARAQEAAALEREQEHARNLVDEPLRREAEHQRIQEVIDVVGRAFFLERYGELPQIVGHDKLVDVYGEFTTPVFAIEYANLRFNPGKYGVHGIKYPDGRWLGRSPFTGRAFRRNFSRTERRVIDEYTPNIVETSFEPVCLCSGCQTWGLLGKFEDTYGSLRITPPNVEKYDYLAHAIEIFNEGGSGLALDCGTLPVFGLDPSKVSTAISCDNLMRAIKAENDRLHPPLSPEEKREIQHAVRNRVHGAISKRQARRRGSSGGDNSI